MTDRATRIESALAERLGRQGGIPTAPPGPAPLSPVQRSLWILSQLAPGEVVNGRPLHLRLGGPLKVAALGGALQRLVERHSVLRSTFPMIEGEPAQIVGDTPTFDLQVTDLASRDDPQAAALECCATHANTVFDLTTESPFVPNLLKLADGDHVLSIAMHHIIFDGWSERRFLDELAALYDAELGDTDAELSTLETQVRDFAAWQATRADEAREEDDLAWWQRQLADLPPEIELPVDRPPLDTVPRSPDRREPRSRVDRRPDMERFVKSVVYGAFGLALR